MTTSTDSPALPVIPAPRAPGCPLAPPAEFAAWRQSPGLQRAVWQGKPVWMISRYADIRSALVDPRLSANTMEFVPDDSPDADVPVIFARLDDPEHHRLRRMLTGEFTYRRGEAMRPRIQELVTGFVDDIVDEGPPAELVGDYALPVPSLVICLLLGVPYDDHEFFQHHSARGLDARSSEEVRMESQLALYGYMVELVRRKELEPGDDLMSRLIADHVVTGELSRQTAAMNGMVLLSAGHETTASMIALGIVALLDNPATYELLASTDDHAVTAAVVEELMRYLTIVHSLIDRDATEDLTIAGQLIRAGEKVLMNLPAGNFDPEFVSAPDDFDIGRATRGHLGFGYGVHQCIGQHLARVELQVALRTLARRLPGLRLAVPAAELRFQNTQEIYGIEELPVTW